MSHSIHHHTEVEKIIHFGGTKRETSIRTAFFYLLNDYAKQRGLMMVAEVSIKTPGGKAVTPDGTLKDNLRQDWDYWESKDEADNFDEEILKKLKKGYPKDNILFEDSRVVVLIQNGIEVLRCYMEDSNALHLLLTEFFSFERPEVQNLRKAIELFKQDIPKVTETIRKIIIEAALSNIAFIKTLTSFLELCRESTNPGITREDVYEMIIHHILTEDIFNTIFDETQFHRKNNIARELETVIATFFTGNLRCETLRGVKHYCDAINAAAAGIADHHKNQKFLKIVYETFYKSYNPKAADRLSVVYTLNEIVRFMIESADDLLHKHFDKYLGDRNVEILDPATGTGTSVCDLIGYICKEKLEYKYCNKIHANEVATLPYYISNLIYAQKMGRYVEFENLCFVDTLDNMGFSYKGKQHSFNFFSEGNSKRIQKQNEKKIVVIIGNQPYNANQANENDNNKNREYPEIDKHIKDTFIKHSMAQKTKAYDMYVRFYRWAFDLLEENGIVTFVNLASDTVFDFALLIVSSGQTQCFPLYRYDKNGNRIENITDWGLEQFVKHYNDDVVTKQDIFHYVYAVMHFQAYHKKYELKLKREFSRISFYKDFHQWATWGEQLMNLHINYETVKPYQLSLFPVLSSPSGEGCPKDGVRCKLKAIYKL